MMMTPAMRGSSPPSSLHLLMMSQMQKESQNSRPHEEEHLHDAYRKRRLEHRARLLQVLREWIPGLFTRESERA